MTTKLKGEDDLNHRLHALQNQGKPIMGLLGLAAVREQKLLVPRKTGNLGRTIHLASVGPRSATTEASASYAASVEFGHKQFDVVPRNKKALRFPAKGAAKTLSGRVKSGGFAFAKKVTIPATRPQPYMVPGARKALQRAGDIAAGVLIKAWNKAA